MVESVGKLSYVEKAGVLFPRKSLNTNSEKGTKENPESAVESGGSGLEALVGPCMCLDQRFPTSGPQGSLTPSLSDYSVGGTDFFSLRLSK